MWNVKSYNEWYSVFKMLKRTAAKQRTFSGYAFWRLRGITAAWDFEVICKKMRKEKNPIFNKYLAIFLFGFRKYTAQKKVLCFKIFFWFWN